MKLKEFDRPYSYDDYCSWDTRELAVHLMQHEDNYIKLYHKYQILESRYKELLQD